VEQPSLRNLIFAYLVKKLTCLYETRRFLSIFGAEVADTSALKMRAAFSSETAVSTYMFTHRCKPEEQE
jgi:hypothetical protein